MRDHRRMNQPGRRPSRPRPVRATVAVPGSKSITNRALLLAALSEGGGTLTGALRSRDTDLMVAALRALGVPSRPTAATAWRVGAARRAARPGRRRLRAGRHGDAVRAAGRRARRRARSASTATRAPASGRWATVLDALRALGATIDGDALPFTVHGKGGLPGGAVTIDASASSQFVSGPAARRRPLRRRA